MRVFFLWKCSKFDVNLKNIENNWQKSFCLRDKCIWIGCVKLPLLRREYLSSAVNVLTNNLQIFHVTKRDSFQLNYLHSDQWIWESCCHWDSNRVLARLPRCLSRSPLKRDFLGIYLTTSLGVSYFRDTSAMRVIFFFEKVQNLMQIWKMHKTVRKMFFVFEVNPSELVALNCLY